MVARNCYWKGEKDNYRSNQVPNHLGMTAVAANLAVVDMQDYLDE
jgi:hypothetical protein